MSNKAVPLVRTEKEDFHILLNKQVEFIPDWQEMGACWNTRDEAWFIPEREAMYEVAEICLNECEVRLNCLQRGVGLDWKGIFQPGGVWGGYTPEQRARLRRHLDTAR